MEHSHHCTTCRVDYTCKEFQCPYGTNRWCPDCRTTDRIVRRRN